MGKDPANRVNSLLLLPKMGESRKYRKSRPRSPPARCTSRRYETRFRSFATASARVSASGLPPIVRAWSISNAAWDAYGRSFAPGFKPAEKIAMSALSRTRFGVENSPGRIRPRILFGLILPNRNPKQASQSRTQAVQATRRSLPRTSNEPVEIDPKRSLAH
jgi:hypothetical protein